MDPRLTRREMLAGCGAVGIGLAMGTAQPALGLRNDPVAVSKELKVGVVGIGRRGSTLLRGLLQQDGVRVAAVCDLMPQRTAQAQGWVEEAGQGEPAAYTRGETDYVRMCEHEDLDLVVVATDWKSHTPICVAAMKAGKHAATEVPAALTVAECWQLVNTAEQTGRQCVMLENYCYFRHAMLTMNLVHRGAFGQLLHLEGRTQENWITENWHIFEEDGTLGWCGEAMARRDANQYPTHAVGPMAMWADINRGDRFEYLVSMSSKAVGMAQGAKQRFGDGHALAKREYAQGDANTTLLRTANGVTMCLYFGGTAPQPWSPWFRVQGSTGTVAGDLYDASGERWMDKKIDTSGHGRRWGNLADRLETDDHPLWAELGETARLKRVRNWSGTYDYLMLYQLTQALRRGRAAPMNVYDAATWSAVTALSERSVANRSRPIDFPDFTRGKWKTTPRESMDAVVR